MPSLSLRVNLDPEGRIGPGKIELLENIAAYGSISAAARRMDMSYKHAWDLVEDMNKLFGKPLIAAQTGGKHGGGAQLTPLGATLLAEYRRIESAALRVADGPLLWTAVERLPVWRAAAPATGARDSAAITKPAHKLQNLHMH